MDNGMEWMTNAKTESEPPRTLAQIVEKLRFDADTMESPYWTHEPEEPDWTYVAKAFKEIASEIERESRRQKEDAQLLFVYEQALKEMRTFAKHLPETAIPEWVERIDERRDEHARQLSRIGVQADGQ